ncbi:MAG TPA: hypothetical protein VJN67_04785 [Stellaceae bacterium]|nr:hypothetical protein [Stellaceae bacterium]
MAKRPGDNLRSAFPAFAEAGQPPSGPPERRELHATDIAIIVAIGGSAFCAGLFGFYEDHPILGTIFVLSGLLVMAPISPFVRANIHWLSGRPALWAVSLATWLLLTINIGLKLWPPPAGNDFRADYWTPLTVTQQDALIAKLRSVPRRSVTIQCALRSCNDLADSLVVAFRAVGGWKVTRSKVTGMGSSGTGIFLAPGDETAKLIKGALENAAKLAGVTVSPTTDATTNGMQEMEIYIGIGGKPLDD